MSEHPNTPSETAPAWNTDPFPSPRTMPKGWDLSELIAAASQPESSANGATPSAATSPETGNGYQPEKFSNPRTMPKGWDMSELMRQAPTSAQSNDHQ